MKRIFGRVNVFLALLISICVLAVLYLQLVIPNKKQDRSVREYGNYDGSHKSVATREHTVSDSRMKWKNQEDLNVFIVEEHHAVLKYWFDAVRSGLVQRQGNTLVHIDGHSDLAIPYNTAFFPAFRLPQTPYELEAMMQSNDVFIMGAALSGLFKRVIWIWPSWDKSGHDEINDISLIKLGVTTLNIDDSDEYGHTFCMCYKNVSTSTDMCVYTPVKAHREDLIDIPQSSCDIHTELNIKAVEETISAKVLLAEEIQNDNIVLDIDEDYYGCTLPAQDLVNVGVTVADVQEFNDVLAKIFCPKNPEQEIRTDKLLFTALEMLKSDEACKSVAKFSNCSGFARRASILNYLERESLDLKIRCPLKKMKFTILLRMLVSKFSLFNATQLTVIQRIGFCISTMMPTHSKLWEPTFGVCIGNNVPGETMVYNHPTNSTEVTYRTSILKEILKTLKKSNVQITTVCRSVRDGYTPRKHFRHIENDILGSLNVLGRQTKYHYDSWLLGGKKGWYNR